MVRFNLILIITLLAITICLAQENKILVKAGTEFTVQNETAIDATKLQVGDDLNFKLTEDLKGESGGSISSGSEIYGRVVEVQKLTGDASRVIMIFDFVKNGDDFLMFKAHVLSIENTADVDVRGSEAYEGGTIFSQSGKNLSIASGKRFRVRLLEDMGAG